MFSVKTLDDFRDVNMRSIVCRSKNITVFFWANLE